jgi:hypothetical protein
MSNEASFPTCFEALYMHPLSLPHLPNAFDDVMEFRPVIADLRLHHIHA